MPTDKLYLPNCPYCGGPAWLDYDQGVDTSDGWTGDGYIVDCYNNCESGKTYPYGPDKGYIRKIAIYESTPEEAAKVWQDMVLIAMQFSGDSYA